MSAAIAGLAAAQQRPTHDPQEATPPRGRLQRTGSPVLCPVTALAFYRYRPARTSECAAEAAAAASAAAAVANSSQSSAPVPETPSLLVLAGEDGWLVVYGVGDGDEVADVAAASAGGAAVPARDSLSGRRHRRCYGRFRVFAEQAIQGCRVGDGGGDGADGDNDILVWGGQSVALVSRDHIARLLTADAVVVPPPAVDEVVAPDWIYDGLLPLRDREGEGGGGGIGIGALITAHNEIVPFRVDTKRSGGSSSSPSLVLLGPPISPSRPMLYSAQPAWIDGNGRDGSDSSDSSDSSGGSRLLVVAGTVFGEIVVWTCRLAVARGTSSSSSSTSLGIDVLEVFTGHEGSIFDVVVSPEFDLADLIGGEVPDSRRRVRLLASCSDDRTIRVWPLYLDTDGRGRGRGRGSGSGSRDGTVAPEARVTNEARETGFQNTFEGLAQRSADKQATEAAATTQRNVVVVDKKYLQSTDQPPQSASTAALATVMAHASRIWHVRFGAFETAASKTGDLLLYSFGEDATAQEWQLQLSLGLRTLQEEPDGLSGKLVHLRTLSSHAGKNIWSAVVSPMAIPGETHPRGDLIATGGCDGKICLFEGRQFQNQQPIAHDQKSSLLFPGTIASSTAPTRAEENQITTEGEVASPPQPDDQPAPKAKKSSQKKSREEVFNSYAFLSDDKLLAATASGRLLLGDFRQTSGETAALQWAELPAVSDAIISSLKDYNVVRSPRGGGGGGVATRPGVEGLAVVGNAAGQLFMFSRPGGLQELAAKLPGKVDEIFFLPHTDENKVSTDKTPRGTAIFHLGIIATTLFQDEAALIDLDIDIVQGTLLAERVRTLRLPKKAPASPASMVITAASRCLEYIVLGSRNGQLCLYGPAVGDNDDNDDSAPPPATFVLQAQLQTRTRDAILSIVPLPPRKGHPPLSSASFVVTARDGTYRIYTIDLTKDTTTSSTPATPRICLQHETATPFGPIVRDAWFIDSETPGEPPELVICGFRSTNFVVWNETRQQELAAVDCGGTHRTHTYLFCGIDGGGNGGPSVAKPGTMRFAFTRQSELHVFAQDVCATAPLKTGGHGREIRAISASASGTYVATGGEDTVVRIWTNPGSNSSNSSNTTATGMRCLSVLKLHNTGLHSLAWLRDDCLISAAGSEELFIWRITTIQDSAYDGLAVLCESSYPDSTSDKILRIIGLDASLDPGDTGAMFISVGLSNSIMRTYRYATASGWKLLAQGRYTGACPTQLRHLRLQLGRELVILAAFADGHLSFWKATPRHHGEHQPLLYGDYSLLCATKAHQNAVKALDLTQSLGTALAGLEAASSAAIFTGGDDNAIAVTMLGISSSENDCDYAFGKTYRVSSAHAAAVTGVKILRGEGAETGDSSFTAVSCSNDQRVKAWRVLLSQTGSLDTKTTVVRIQLLDDRYSAIADPGDVESVGSPNGASAMVVGMGMETWSLCWSESI